MVSLSNHEAPRTDGYARPSWFDKLTMKALAQNLAFPDIPCLRGYFPESPADCGKQAYRRDRSLIRPVRASRAACRLGPAARKLGCCGASLL